MNDGFVLRFPLNKLTTTGDAASYKLARRINEMNTTNSWCMTHTIGERGPLRIATRINALHLVNVIRRRPVNICL